MEDEGWAGWFGMTAWIFLWDIWALRTNHQTMTSAFKKLTQNPYGRILLTAIWGALTLHLFTEKADRSSSGCSEIAQEIQSPAAVKGFPVTRLPDMKVSNLLVISPLVPQSKQSPKSGLVSNHQIWILSTILRKRAAVQRELFGSSASVQ